MRIRILRTVAGSSSAYYVAIAAALAKQKQSNTIEVQKSFSLVIIHYTNSSQVATQAHALPLPAFLSGIIKV
ncbi:hypothetical protein F4678DRAFT_421089, partial [Xylaria arbuscula]